MWLTAKRGTIREGLIRDGVMLQRGAYWRGGTIREEGLINVGNFLERGRTTEEYSLLYPLIKKFDLHFVSINK